MIIFNNSLVFSERDLVVIYESLCRTVDLHNGDDLTPPLAQLVDLVTGLGDYLNEKDLLV